MRYLKQFAIIILISLMGELLSEFLPFSMPASIYGLLIMLTLLITGVIKVEHVKETSTFLLDIMPIMFIPPAVGLMDNWDILKGIILPLILIGTVSTVVVMVVTGRVTQSIIRKKLKKLNNMKREDV